MRTTILLAIAITAFAACRSESDNDGTRLGTTSMQSDAKHPASPGGTAVVPDVSAGTTVIVLLEDRHIAVRETAIPPGPAVFTVTNGGDQLHNLYIEGPGVRKAAGDPIAENGTRTVSAVLQPGTYTLYCPILDHREKGEQATFTVRG
jgi:hypothetical protein